MNSSRRLFGTDGIRGVANTWPMDSRAALLAGQAIAAHFREGERRHRVIIGKDTRLSGYMIETALASGMVAMGVDVYLVGPLPTPGIAFITQSMRADVGVVISASHNSYEYNGIKVFDRQGYKLQDRVEAELERLMLDDEELGRLRVPPERIGKAFRIDDAVGRYVVSLKSALPRDLTLDGMRIVVDCANGATYKVAPEVFSELGAQVFPVGVTPNGMNINLGVGSTAPEAAQQRVRELGADLGICLDGDGDRVVFVDERGHVVDGDAVMAFVGLYLLQRGQLGNRTLVATIASNLGLDLTMQQAGGQVVRTDVGDRYVSQRMREVGSNFGGESSGHLIFLDASTTGDGTLAALEVLRVMRETGLRLSELAEQMLRIPQAKRDIPVPVKVPLDELPGFSASLRKVEEELSPRGRVVVRYSGTEPKARIIVEGENAVRIRELADTLAGDLDSELRARAGAA